MFLPTIIMIVSSSHLGYTSPRKLRQSDRKWTTAASSTEVTQCVSLKMSSTAWVGPSTCCCMQTMSRASGMVNTTLHKALCCHVFPDIPSGTYYKSQALQEDDRVDVGGLASSPRTRGVLRGDPGEAQELLLLLPGLLCVRRGPGCCVREITNEACTQSSRTCPQPPICLCLGLKRRERTRFDLLVRCYLW